MQTIKYSQIFLVGASQLAAQCMKILTTSALLPVHHLDTDQMQKTELMQTLAQVRLPTLVLSIMNPYIFTAEAVENPALTIVNLHHGILPGHRGRNAQAWAIFYEEAEAGFTWHYVDCGVDTGSILQMERIPITEKDTALSLMRKQNRLIPESLQSILPRLLFGEIQTKKPANRPSFFHLSKDAPNNGILELSWSGHKMSCFLRSMDFGILKVMGEPVLKWQDMLWHFKSYKIEHLDQPAAFEIICEGDSIQITKDSYRILLKHVCRAN